MQQMNADDMLHQMLQAKQEKDEQLLVSVGVRFTDDHIMLPFCDHLDGDCSHNEPVDDWDDEPNIHDEDV
jgi:hypothetical protein